LRARPAETPDELAARATALGLIEPEVAHRLADGVNAALYAPEGVSDEVAHQIALDADALAEVVEGRLAVWPRWRRRLDPRRLWRSGRTTRPRRR
jgi:hypothetical protein